VGTGFNPELTGRENIFLNGAILGMSRKEILKKFDEIVSFAEVEKFLDTPVKRYSSGMHVRLAFAVAANLDPEILLVDEVLAVGDAQFQKKCIGKMEDVNKNEGRTILFVSHNMSIVNQFCNKAMLLERGRMIAMDSADNILDRYLAGMQHFNSEYLVDTAKAISRQNHFVNMFLTNEAGTKAADFSFNESMVLNMNFKVRNPISKIHVVVDFRDRYQAKIFSIIQPLSFFNRNEDTCHAAVRIPSSLIAPGFYSFSFTMVETTGEIHDQVEAVCACQIHDTGVILTLPGVTEGGAVIVNPVWLSS
jgi:lipopolysaccharide transport system ATP-binding protein